MSGTKKNTGKSIFYHLSYLIGYLQNFDFKLNHNLAYYFKALTQEIFNIHRHHVDEVSNRFVNISNQNYEKSVENLRLIDDKFNKNLKIQEKHLADFNKNLYNLNAKMHYIIQKLDSKTLIYTLYDEDSQISKMEKGQ